MSRFRAVSEGIEVTLIGPEIAVLYQLARVLGSAGVDKDDPARARLTPRIDGPVAGRDRAVSAIRRGHFINRKTAETARELGHFADGGR